MEKFVKNYLTSLKLGKVQGFENMAVYPLLSSLDGAPAYITLKEALDAGVFTVAEVSEGGSVPELKAENKDDIAVLLLDGEEVFGAKQNRILNTTILVAPKSSIKVPVSCTEQGRWSYMSRDFYESGNVMAPSMRRDNMRAVHFSLANSRQFRSDQGEVWDKISEMAFEAKVALKTGAMKDIYDAKKAILDDYLAKFKVVVGQKGLLVFIDGKPAGLDLISRGPAFETLFPKLVKSFAIEAMLAKEREPHAAGAQTQTKEAKPKSKKQAPKPSEKEARDFLTRAAECEEKKYESVGLGSSYRYTGRNMVGSALAVEGQADPVSSRAKRGDLTADETSAVIHMAFFSVTEADKSGNMAGMSRRRMFRI